LYEHKDVKGFLKYYNEHETELKSKAPKLDFWYYKIAEAYNQEFFQALGLHSMNLRLAMEKPEIPIEAWKDIRIDHQAMDQAIKEYNDFALLKDERFRAHEVNDLNELSQTINTRFLGSLTSSFARYLNSSITDDFVSIYPISSIIKEKDIWHENLQEALNRSAGYDDLKLDFRFSSAVRLLKDEDLGKYIESIIKFEKKKLTWLIFASTFDQMRSMGVTDGTLNNLFAKYVDVAIVESPDQEGVCVFSDFALVNKTRQNPQEFVEYLSKNKKRFNIIVAGCQPKVDREVTDKKEIDSKFLSGYHLELNPDFDVAQTNVEIARQNYANAMREQQRFEAQNTGAAGLAGAFAGAAVGFQLGAAQGQLQNAYTRLQNTPRQLRVPDYTDYVFTQSEVTLSKKLNFSVFCMQNDISTILEFTDNRSSKGTFRIAYNVNPKDTRLYAIKGECQEERAIELSEKEPFRLSLAEISKTFTGNPATVNQEVFYAKIVESGQKPADDGQKINHSLTKPMKDARMKSVVVVQNPKGSLGTGFFVSKNLILTNQHVIEGTRFPEVKFLSGETVVAKVVKIDLGLDLALIQCNKTGDPLEFLEDNPESGTSVDAIGHPKGLTFSLTRGIISAVRYIANPLVPGSRKMLVIQTDTPINPGNSGGPLLVGDKVIGINSQKLSGPGLEGLGFALHASEIKAFLAEVN